MNKILIIVGAVVLIGAGVGFFLLQSSSEPSLTPTLTPQESPMGFPSASPAVSPTATVKVSPSPTATVTASPSPTGTPAPTVSSTPRQHSVKIQSFVYVSNSLTVKRGDTVVFTNLDAAPHTATALNGSFDTGTLGQNQSFTLNTATLAPGTYQYRCTPHSAMTGTITVQ